MLPGQPQRAPSCCSMGHRSMIDILWGMAEVFVAVLGVGYCCSLGH